MECSEEVQIYPFYRDMATSDKPVAAVGCNISITLQSIRRIFESINNTGNRINIVDIQAF